MKCVAHTMSTLASVFQIISMFLEEALVEMHVLLAARGSFLMKPYVLLADLSTLEPHLLLFWQG